MWLFFCVRFPHSLLTPSKLRHHPSSKAVQTPWLQAMPVMAQVSWSGLYIGVYIRVILGVYIGVILGYILGLYWGIY